MRLKALIFLGILVPILAACQTGSEPTQAPTALTPTVAPAAATPTVASVAPSPTPTATSVMAPSPVPTAVPVASSPTPTATSAMAPSPTQTAAPQSETLVIEVKAQFARFTPSSITMRAGEPVQFKVTSLDSTHTFTFELNGQRVNLSLVRGEATTSEVFTFQEGQTITFWCAVPGHRGAGMEGTISTQASGAATPSDEQKGASPSDADYDYNY